MKLRQFFLWLCVVLPLLGYGQMDVLKMIDHDGETREYEVHLPTGYDGNGTAYPLIINMHGLGSSRNDQAFYSYFNSVADTAGIVVVYPQGLPVEFWGAVQNHWNAGFGTGVDDLGFIDKMLTELLSDYNLDPARVYATGMSNGGYMSYYLACEMSDRIAAIASVTGSMPLNVLASCNADYTVPVMQIHGTDDGVVPFDGPPSINRVVDFWVNQNDCMGAPEIDSIPDIQPLDQCTAVKYTYTDCQDNHEVWYYVITGGGHTWPGAFPLGVLGNTNQDFKASEHIWWFFRKFTHPNPTIITNVDEENLNSTWEIVQNPVTDKIYLVDLVQRSNYTIMGLFGQLVQKGSTNGQIEITNLPTGTYILSINNRSKILVVTPY